MSKLAKTLQAAAGNVGVGGTSDENFSNVTLLLQADTENTANNNTFLDSSLNNNFTITRNGNPTQGTFSPYGDLWSVGGFIPNGGSLQAPSTAGNFGSADWTVEFWVNTTSVDGPGIVTQATGPGAAATSWGFFVGYGTSKNVALYLSDGSNYFASIITGTTPVSDGAWHHVAASRSGSTAYLFLDGVLQGTTSVGSTALGNGGVPVHIGGQGTSSAYMLFNGNISNVRITKNTALYTTNFTPSTTPLTALAGTSLLTCQSNRFVDNSANNLTLISNTHPSVERFSPFAPTASYDPATIGGSVYLDGSEDYLSTPASSTWVTSSSGYLTIEFWAYAESNGYYYLMDQPSGNVSAIAINFDPTSGYLYWYKNGWLAQISSLNIPAKTWNHFAFVLSAGVPKVYINGVQKSGSYTNGGFFENQPIDIGRYSGGSGYDFPGYITDFRIVTNTAVYTTNFTPPTAPLTPVTNTALLLNATNAGIIDNAMMNDLETVGNAQVSTSVVKYGTGSLYFDGSGDYLTTVNKPPINLEGDFTVEAWLYQTNAAQNSPLISLGSDTSQSGTFLVYIDTNQKLSFFLNGSNNAGSLTAAINTWHHVALVRSGSTVTTYLNGVLQNTVATSTTFSGPIELGTTFYAGSRGFGHGYIDDLRITKGIARYTTNFTPPDAALLGK